ncbi:hypothetical protein [Actinomadura sp. DC4]|uniref:Acg family FMN-binding oxidoreductase n=1 Tax=Actinomadura sp. DC4 TaxID=3055069 RepID=UPI0025B0AF73|nr:hypothetical protein [Actinomadura sp. DC4]MDN3359762.1 hypothetical protein [Actinomadura sp. DC4]
MKSITVAPASADEVAAFLIEAAGQAPSVHNTQPWWFGVRGSRLTVHADADRRLDVADPDGREMLISCGAALFTLRLAARHLGYAAEERLWPDPERTMLLADVDIARQRPATADEQRMFAQVSRRRTHRGGFTPERPPPALLSKLSNEARREGASLRLVADPRARQAMAALSETAEQTQRLSVDYTTEVARWAPAPGDHRNDGVQPGAYPREPRHTAPYFATRDFARGQGWGHHDGDSRDATGTVALLMTPGDTPADWLNAGMALQRVLLCAAEEDVSAAFHTQALELPELRDFIRTRFCGGAHPQMLMRLGHTGGEPADGVRRPETDIARDEP